MKKNYPHQVLFEIPFFNGTLSTAVHFVEKHLQQHEGLLTIATPNPEQIVQMEELKEFKQNLSQFDFYIPDGQGIALASYLKQRSLQSRITGIDLVIRLLEFATQNELKVMVVGGLGYDKYKIQDIRFKWIEGYRNISTLSTDALKRADEEVMKSVLLFKPQIVFVALGAPHQEAWVIRNREQLEKSGVRVAMVVGGAFDTLTGKVPRAPLFLRKIGFEWLFRLIQEPWRWRRQLRLLKFIQLAISD